MEVYEIEFTCFVEVEAETPEEAVQLAIEQENPPAGYGIWVDGTFWS